MRFVRGRAIEFGLSGGCCFVYGCCRCGVGVSRSVVLCFAWGGAVVCITMLAVLFDCRGTV